MAVAQGHTEIVEMLVDGGADMNRRQGVHWDAVHASAAAGRPDIVRLLRAKGAVYSPWHLKAAEESMAKHRRLSQVPYYQDHFPPDRMAGHRATIMLLRELLGLTS